MDLPVSFICKFCAILVLVSLCSAFNKTSKDDPCTGMLDIDCNTYREEGNETLCASDYNTYRNLCFFAKQKCEDPVSDLTILYYGECKMTTAIPTQTTTTVPLTTSTPPSNSSDIIHDVFCVNKDQIDCVDTLDPVCGSDFTFYRNNCEFAKAQCDHPELYVQELTACKSSRRSRRSLRFRRFV